MKGIKPKSKKVDRILCTFFLFYSFTVIWFTVLGRTAGFRIAQTEILWSYRRWAAGDWELGMEILGNIAMFIPFGFLLTGLLKERRGFFFITACAVAFSLTIESMQLVLMRGLFEWDDLISNGTGAICGWALYWGSKKMLPQKAFQAVPLLAGALCVFVCVGVLANNQSFAKDEVDNTSKVYCFQIDESSVNGEDMTLTGFAFRYEKKPVAIQIVLQSTSNGSRIKLDTTRTARPDVNDYFLCEYDYEYTGFVAKGTVDVTEEYEVLIQWPWAVPVSTGVFVSSTNVHYAAERTFIAPKAQGTELEPFVNKGILRVYRPDHQCWVYQYENALYWIAGPGFYFEDDGTTYIQYQLDTTQVQNLPVHRLEHDWFWDNIGAYFEDNEIEGDFGEYRVMRREIPTEYSITAITTGYHTNGSWIWKNYFRPYYVFGNEMVGTDEEINGVDMTELISSLHGKEP